MKRRYCIIRCVLLFIASFTTGIADAQSLHETFAKKILQFDTSFTNHCEIWEIKNPNKKLLQSGNFKIIAAHNDKAEITSKHTSLLFKKSSIEKNETANLTILYNSKDSVFINMVLHIADAEQGKQEYHATEIINMNLQTTDDTAWKFLRSVYAKPHDTTTINFGKLTNEKDTISINYVTGFGDMKLYRNYSTGLTFTYNAIPVAALQYERHDIVWLSNLADEKIKVIAGSFITAYIAALQH